MSPSQQAFSFPVLSLFACSVAQCVLLLFLETVLKLFLLLLFQSFLFFFSEKNIIDGNILTFFHFELFETS